VEGDRNGLKQIGPILESHKPLDFAVILLGTNDLKLRFSPTALDIAKGVQNIVTVIQNSHAGPANNSPKIVMICPPPTADSAVFEDLFGKGNNRELSEKLPAYYADCARESGVSFLDAGKVIQSCKADGIHFEPESHHRLAEAVAEIIRKI
jgi:lysophospholipase L1-like esterase